MKHVLLLLADGFEVYEAAAFFDVMGWNLVDGDGSTKITVCGFRKKVKSTFGTTWLADITLEEIDLDDYHALAIPGGFVEFDFYKQAYSEPFLQIIRAFNRQEKPIASICTGALPIAKSGILEGRQGTTYNMRDGIRQKSLAEFGVNVLNEPIVVDSNVITSWNPSTAMEVAFNLLEKITSRENASNVKRLMGF